MNDSPDSSDKLKQTHQEPKRTHQELVEGIAGGRTLVETMVRGENAGTARAAGVRTKWQGDGTEGSPVYTSRRFSLACNNKDHLRTQAKS